jgi:hypothetical protein
MRQVDIMQYQTHLKPDKAKVVGKEAQKTRNGKYNVLGKKWSTPLCAEDHTNCAWLIWLPE